MRQIFRAQETELTEHAVYSKLAQWTREDKNKKVLENISNDEKRHALFWEKYTQQKAKAKPFKIFFHTLIAKLLGFTFSVKLMEKGEEAAQVNYGQIAKEIPEAKVIGKEEDEHEKQLLGLLDEEKLKYVGSMVLGVNDALVELTGALAGLTLALQNSRLIAMIGLITGIAASLSMAASEYLSATEEADIHKGHQKPGRGAAYTGIAYIITVLILITPFLLLPNAFIALAITLVLTVSVIAFYTFYISVAKGHSFWGRFGRMAAISLGVAGISFVIGLLVKIYFGVDA